MRKAFSAWLEKAMVSDGRICVIDADLANADGTLGLRKLYPERAFDVGVAEQNMVGVAAGLASYGFIPFVTTFACFASRRVCDQIAISCAYSGQRVRIVGTDPGVTAELNGGTHMALEDLGVLRSIPNLLLFEPCDERELVTAMPQIVERGGPVYIRLNRKETPDIHAEDYQCRLEEAELLREGVDLTLFASGCLMVGNALKAAELLKEEGISAEVINVHTIKPLDQAAVVASLRKTGAAVTCENHNVIGGLYSAVCEAAAAECPRPIRAIGFQDVKGEVGSVAALAAKKGLLPKDICAAARAVLKAKSSQS